MEVNNPEVNHPKTEDDFAVPPAAHSRTGQ
jgi:hypothetical protein